MFKYLIRLLFVGLLFLNLGLNAQDSTGTTISTQTPKNQTTPEPKQTTKPPTRTIAPTDTEATTEIESPIVIPIENRRRLNEKPTTTADLKINEAINSTAAIEARVNNPFALIRNGKPQKSKEISMFPVTSKKQTKVEEVTEEAEIEQEEIITETFEPVDTSTLSLNNKNPFRLEGNQIERQRAAKATKIKFNPNAGTGVKNTKEKSKPLFDTSKVDVNQSDTLKFTLLTILLAILSFIVARFRSELTEVYQAFLSQNLMALLYRDKETIFRFPYLSMYLLSVISIGTSIFLVLDLFNIQISANQNYTVLICIAGSTGFFIFKHFILGFLSILFPFKKEVSLYSFSIAIFNFIIGISLLPFVALLSFADDSLHNYVLYAMVILISIILIYRLFRSILISQKYWINNKFHFFMYLCTVEIAPMIILFKFLS